MIKVTDIEISIDPLKILQIGERHDLTLGSKYAQVRDTKIPEEGKGGIIISTELIISEIENGRIFITQVSDYHELEITTDDGKHYLFSNNGRMLNDALGTNTHHKFLTISKNRVLGGIDVLGGRAAYWDAPYIELLSYYEKLRYEIQFETWFQYTNNFGPIKPLFKLRWLLNSVVEKRGEVWEIVSGNQSSIEDIKNSIIHLNPEIDKPLEPKDCSKLYESVNLFLLENGIIRDR